MQASLHRILTFCPWYLRYIIYRFFLQRKKRIPQNRILFSKPFHEPRNLLSPGVHSGNPCPTALCTAYLLYIPGFSSGVSLLLSAFYTVHFLYIPTAPTQPVSSYNPFSDDRSPHPVFPFPQLFPDTAPAPCRRMPAPGQGHDK